MSKTRLLFAFIVSGLASTWVLNANTVLVSVSGQFASTGVTADQLAAPNATWSMSFDVNNPPQETNVSSTGFDTTFTGFSYTLNGTSVSASPQNIRFFTAGGSQDGLFTVYFGPESGFQNGNPIPEFEFLGPQLFTGSTSSAAFSTGSFTGTEWIYSDVSNYDDHVTSTVVRLAAVPEPSTLPLFALPLGLIFFGRSRWIKRHFAS